MYPGYIAVPFPGGEAKFIPEILIIPILNLPIPYIDPLDFDGDGILDETELEIGTNPYVPDTDGDGVNDLDEIKNGSNPRLTSDMDADGDGWIDDEPMEEGNEEDSEIYIPVPEDMCP
jgi:hypothetical protein